MAKLFLDIVISCTVLLYLSSPVASQVECATGQFYACLPGAASYIPCGGADDGATLFCSGTSSICIPGNPAVVTPPTFGTGSQETTICQTIIGPVRPISGCPFKGVKYGLEYSGTPPVPASYCKYYYNCITERQAPIVEECTPNNHFSVAEQKCIASSAAGCNPALAAAGLDCTGTNFFKLDDDTSSCYRYKVCNYQRQRVSVACPSGQYFDTTGTTKSCKTGTPVCGARPTTSPPPASGQACTAVNQRFADPSSCKKYFNCPTASGNSVSMPCPFDYYFNDATNKCGPSNSVCNGRPT